MVNLLSLFNVVMERPFQKALYVPYVEPLIIISMTTTVAKVSINAKYVVIDLSQANKLLHLLFLFARIVDILYLQLKTENILLYINVSTRNVLITPLI